MRLIEKFMLQLGRIQEKNGLEADFFVEVNE